MTRVVVIGGGIAGASAGYELSERADVTLVERESTCGYHSTGRSAALFTECYGDRAVRKLAAASRSFIADPPPGFASEPLLKPRSLLFLVAPGQEQRLGETLDEYRAMVPTVQEVTADVAVAMCPVLAEAKVSGAILEPDAMDLDVHGLHLGYLSGLRERGGRIVTSAEVTGLTPGQAGWIVEAGGKDYPADVVVDAAGAWADVVAALAGASSVGLVPKRRTAFTFRPPQEAARWPMVLDLEESFYFRPEGVHLLASPCDTTPMQPHDVRHTEMDVALGIQRIEDWTTMRVRSVTHAWAGLRSFVADSLPVNGWDPLLPGFYWLAGQGGFGIKTAPAMARFAASMILDGAPPHDLVRSGVTPEVLGVSRLVPA